MTLLNFGMVVNIHGSMYQSIEQVNIDGEILAIFSYG